MLGNFNLAQGAKTAGAGDGSGYYYVMVANHSGDTRGQPWYTDLTCLAVDATLIPDAIQQQATAPAPNVIVDKG